MDAVLHKNEGSPAGWILADCERINITATNCIDQYTAVKTTIGIS